MAKITHSEPRYIKSRDGRCITCLIDAGVVVRDKIVATFTAKGVAVQNANDCYDETTGKRLAESRAKRYMFMQAKNFFKTQVAQLKDYLLLHDELQKAVEKYKKSQRHEKNHIQYILDNISC
jgi:hypothetical protein